MSMLRIVVIDLDRLDRIGMDANDPIDVDSVVLAFGVLVHEESERHLGTDPDCLIRFYTDVPQVTINHLTGREFFSDLDGWDNPDREDARQTWARAGRPVGIVHRQQVVIGEARA